MSTEHVHSIFGSPAEELPDGKRNYLTAEEFLAHVEAHRVARLKEKRKSRKPYQPGPFVRTYQLNPHLMYVPKPKVARREEDTP